MIEYGNLRSEYIAVTGNINEGHDMHSKLTENRSNDVDVEDIRLWSFLGEALDRLGARDG